MWILQLVTNLPPPPPPRSSHPRFAKEKEIVEEISCFVLREETRKEADNKEKLRNKHIPPYFQSYLAENFVHQQKELVSLFN